MVKRQYNRSLLKQVEVYTKPNSEYRPELEKYLGKTLTIYGNYDRIATTVLGETSICITDVKTGYGEFVADHAWILLTPTSRKTYWKLKKCMEGTKLKIYCDVRTYEDKRFGLSTTDELWDPVEIMGVPLVSEDNQDDESHTNPPHISSERDSTYLQHYLC